MGDEHDPRAREAQAAGLAVGFAGGAASSLCTTISRAGSGRLLAAAGQHEQEADEQEALHGWGSIGGSGCTGHARISDASATSDPASIGMCASSRVPSPTGETT